MPDPRVPFVRRDFGEPKSARRDQRGALVSSECHHSGSTSCADASGYELESPALKRLAVDGRTGTQLSDIENGSESAMPQPIEVVSLTSRDDHPVLSIRHLNGKWH